MSKTRILAVLAELDGAADEYQAAKGEMECRREALAAASTRLRDLIDASDAEAGIRPVRGKRK